MKSFKRIMAMTIVAVMVMALIPFSASAASTWSGGASSSFEGGTGTEADPYLIASANQLAYLAKLSRENESACAGKYFKLTDDIDLANLDWTPIGNSSTPFGGYFDGDGHTVKGLHVDTTESHAGLFGKASGATIKSLTVEGSLVNSANYSGAIAGLVCNSSSLINCSSNVELITATNAKTSASTGLGGIVGRCEKTNNDGDYDLIVNCTSNSTVGKATDSTVKNSFIGGIAGVAGSTVMIGCRNTGNVTAQASSNICCVGGILGCMGASDGEVILLLNSSMGKIVAYESSDTAKGYAGGIVGRVGHAMGGLAFGNYADADVYTYENGTENAIDKRAGSLFGYIKDIVNAYSNYSVKEPLVGEDSTESFPEEGAIKITDSVLYGFDVFIETKIPDTALKAASGIVEASVNWYSSKFNDDNVAKINAALEGKNVYEYIAEKLLAEYSIDNSTILVETDVLGGMPLALSAENSAAFAVCVDKLFNESYKEFETLVDETPAADEKDTVAPPADSDQNNEPDQTSTPDQTEVPDQTEAPIQTETPVQTQEPDGTDKPAENNGCKSVVVSGTAVIVMAAAAFVVLKKKD